MNVKKSTIIWIVIALIIAVGYGTLKSSYNSMVALSEQVTSSWSNVENQYQRRADLIPNLVNTVKGYATHEQSTLEGVVEARSKAMRTTVNVDDASSVAEYQKAQGELSQALGRLMVLTENYPDLKANKSFEDLQTQLEGTENRIATERGRFNEVTKSYNMTIKSFPKNILASMFGFEQKSYFEALEGSEKAPEVKF